MSSGEGEMMDMDEIETGYSLMMKKIEEMDREREALSEEVRKKDALLLGRMAALTAPLIAKIGMNMLKQGKPDSKGDLYDTVFYPQRMIVLGKTDSVAMRPDNISKPVNEQFCVLSEDGSLYELMYSMTDIVVDSYLNPLTPEQALIVYGHDIMFMLYRAMHDYLKGQEELVEALKKTLSFAISEE